MTSQTVPMKFILAVNAKTNIYALRERNKILLALSVFMHVKIFKQLI